MLNEYSRCHMVEDFGLLKINQFPTLILWRLFASWNDSFALIWIFDASIINGSCQQFSERTPLRMVTNKQAKRDTSVKNQLCKWVLAHFEHSKKVPKYWNPIKIYIRINYGGAHQFGGTEEENETFSSCAVLMLDWQKLEQHQLFPSSKINTQFDNIDMDVSGERRVLPNSVPFTKGVRTIWATTFYWH